MHITDRLEKERRFISFFAPVGIFAILFFINQITIPSVEDRNKALRLWLVWLGTLHAAYQDGVWTVSVAILARY